MPLILNMILALLVAGCTPVPTIKLQLSNCDPRIRDDCWAIPTELVEHYLELEKSLRSCQQRL